MTDQPKLIVERTDPQGGRYAEQWFCEPPAIGVCYVVKRQEWTGDYTVCRIHEIELIELRRADAP